MPAKSKKHQQLMSESPQEVPQSPILVESVSTLDADFSGESQFARLAISSLRAFAARHGRDTAVTDAYEAAIRALETLPGVLAAAQDRAAGAITRLVLDSSAEGC